MKAAVKAVIMNRIGDFFFIMGVAAVFSLYRSVDFLTVFAAIPYYRGAQFNLCGYSVLYSDYIGLCFFIGAVAKSAQVGLHT